MAHGVEARRIAYRLASTQAGVIARRQLRAASVADHLIDRWLNTGYLIRVLPGIYFLGRPAESLRALWMAGVLHAGGRAALGGESAAHALGIASTSGPIEVVRPNGRGRRLRARPPHDCGEFVLRRATLETSDVISVGPVPVLEPARLLVDLAGRTTQGQLRRHFLEAGRKGLLTPECLSRIIERSCGFAGRDRLLALHAKWDPSAGRIRSVLEGEFKLMCAEQGLPPPLANQMVGRYEVDVLWKNARLIVELDGRRFHGDAVALEADSAKTRELRRLGYRVLRFTWNDVVGRPENTALRIRAELR